MTEFGLKDFLVYCLKKWFILFAIAIITAATIFSYIYVTREASSESYVVEASFCTMEEYASKRPDIMVQGSQTTTDIYLDASKRTISLMSSERVKTDFYNSATELFNRLYSPDKPRDNFLYEFRNNFVIVSAAPNFSLEIKGAFKTQNEKDVAKDILILYMTKAFDAVEAEFPSNVEFLTLHLPIKTIEVSGDGFSFFSTLIMSLLFGALISIAVGFVVFLIDPSFKSEAQLGEQAGEILGKTRGEAVSEQTINYICAKTKADKILFISSCATDKYSAQAANDIAKVFSSVDLKTLFINLCEVKSNGDTTTLRDVFDGKKIDSDGDFDVIYAKNANDWMVFLNDNHKALQGIKKDYDKIVIAFCESGGGATAINNISDKTVVVINRGDSKIGSIKKLYSSVDNKPVFGTYIYNL